MSGTVHTPGPWQVVCRNGSAYVYQRGADIMSVLPVAEAKSGKPLSADGRATAEANARYIVTACNAFPELLKALEICLAMGKRELKKGMSLSGQSPYDIGLAALKKARGETQ